MYHVWAVDKDGSPTEQRGSDFRSLDAARKCAVKYAASKDTDGGTLQTVAAISDRDGMQIEKFKARR